MNIFNKKKKEEESSVFLVVREKIANETNRSLKEIRPDTQLYELLDLLKWTCLIIELERHYNTVFLDLPFEAPGWNKSWSFWTVQKLAEKIENELKKKILI